MLALLVSASACAGSPTPGEGAAEPLSAASDQLMDRFLASHPPAVVLDMVGRFGAEGRGALLDPSQALPQWHRAPYEQAAALARYARTCRPEDAPAAVIPVLAKALRWERHLCDREAPPLDDAFFAAPPYMHPSGRSFAALAGALEKEPWRRDHVREMHVTELGRAPTEDPEARVLRGLSWTSLRALGRGDPLVLDPRWLLVQVPGYERADGRDVLHAFARGSWDAHARGSALLLAPRASGGRCLAAATPDLCWQSAPPSSLRAVGFGALLTLGLTAAAFAYARLRARREAQEDRVLILRTLTHEIRTPATSLALGLEPLRKAYDEIPAKLQESLLRVCDDAERIQRVIAISASWLSLQQPGKLRGLSVRSVPAAGELLASVVEGYGDEVSRKGPDPDGPLSTDPRWLQICLRNLIDNALAHGKPPVRVAARWEPRGLVIDVIDAGDTRGMSLSDLTAAFRKGPSSTGLGLGLSIVARTARSLGGKLEHHAEPTTFRLRIAHLPGEGR